MAAWHNTILVAFAPADMSLFTSGIDITDLKNQSLFKAKPHRTREVRAKETKD